MFSFLLTKFPESGGPASSGGSPTVARAPRAHQSNVMPYRLFLLFFMEQNQLLLLTVKSAYLLTFKLYCVTEVDSLLLCLSQPRNFEEYKAHIALCQKTNKDLSYFTASTSCLACCPQLVEVLSHLLGPSSLGPDRVTIKLVVFPGHQNATFKNFHRSHPNLPTESS